MSGTTPIRVMIVDDSLIVRRLVEDSLKEVSGIEVVATASNGKLALERIPDARPDVVTLDVEMPELDGLSTLKRVRATHPHIHVIMFSSLTDRAAAATLEALAAGAADYATKPQGGGGMTATRERIREQLVPKIQALCARKPMALAATRPIPIVQPPPAAFRTSKLPITATPAPGITSSLPHVPSQIVAVGVSTGGPAALHALLGELRPLPVPVLIVQHMPATFTSELARQLARSARMPVIEAHEGEVLVPGRVWLAPGDRHLVVSRGPVGVQLHLDDGPPESSCRPAVDVLFRSVAAVYGARALAIVLTGMGQDGLKGCEAIRAAGGRVFAQDAGTAVVWGMPGAVARAGLADRILPLGNLPSAIEEAVSSPLPIARDPGGGPRERT